VGTSNSWANQPTRSTPSLSVSLSLEHCPWFAAISHCRGRSQSHRLGWRTCSLQLLLGAAAPLSACSCLVSLVHGADLRQQAAAPDPGTGRAAVAWQGIAQSPLLTRSTMRRDSAALRAGPGCLIPSESCGNKVHFRESHVSVERGSNETVLSALLFLGTPGTAPTAKTQPNPAQELRLSSVERLS